MRKHLNILVVVLLVVGMLAGCQSAAPAATTAPATTQAASAAPTAEPTVGPPAKLTGITTTQAADTPFPFPIQGVMAKAANVEITWQHVGITDWAAQKPVMLASGDMPDIWFSGSLTDAEVNSGVFLDLAPFIDKAANIKKFLDTVPDAKATCTNPEGTIYGLPSRHAVRPEAADTLYVNKAWCDKLGIKLPTTLDEYEAMLKAFVTGDPNGNGKKDEVGYTGYFKLPITIPGAQLSSMGTLQCFMPSFGVVVSQGMSVSTLCMIVDGKVVFAPTTDGYKQCLIWLNKLYSEGLIDSELFTLDPPGMMAKLGGEVCTAGSSSAWTKEAFCFANAPQFEYIAPLKNGANGPQYWRADSAFMIFANCGAVAASCKDPDAAMRFFDQCYDEKNSLQIAYGSDGVGTSFKDGKPMLIPGPDGSTSDAFRFTCSSDAMGPGWASDEFAKSVTGQSDLFKKYDVSEFYRPYYAKQFNYPLVKWDKDTMDQLSTLQTDVNTYVDTANVNFIMKGGVEAGWQAYLDQLNKMGLDKLMQIYTKGYEDSKK